MTDPPSPDRQLVAENARLQRRIEELEHADAERQRAEGAHCESKSLLESIVSGTTDAIFAKDLEGKYTLFNKAAASVVGKDLAEVVGKDDYALFSPDEARKVMEGDRKVVEGQSVLTYEETVTAADGEVRSFLSTKGPVFDASGRKIGLFGIARDITTRKRAEEERVRTLSLLTSTMESTADGILVVDGKGKIVWLNAQFKQMWGIPDAVVASKDDNAALGYVLDRLKEPGQFLKTVRDLYDRPEAVSLDVLEFKDGRVFERYSQPQRIGDAIVGRVWSFRDITERKRAEARLRETAERLQLATFAAKAGVWDWNLETNEAVWDDRMLELYGLTRESFTGRVEAWWQGLHPDDRSRVIAESDAAVRGEQRYDTAFRVRRPDATVIYLKADGHVLRDDQGKALRMIGLNIDITDRKRAEEEKARLEAQLQQAQKMESVGRLAGGVAHDFNNMLGVILGHAELALKQLAPGQQLRADLTEIRDAATRSANLTRQLLAFARKQTVAPKVLDLNETVASLLTMIGRLIREDIDLEWHPGADLWSVKVDPSQIDQILTNLCVNARDAITGVGHITIETSNATFDKAYCADHPGFAPGEYVRLAASDDGSGMDRETQGHLFEPFFTTKEQGKGTGLGLATVYGIVKQNEGFINVSSEPGRGTTFAIYLPRHAGWGDRATLEHAAGAVARGREVILLVEDEPAILRLTTTMLEEEGYTVLPAHTPGEAIRLALDYVGAIDLLMTDVVMPEMNGRDLARNVLSIHPRIGRLFMSGYTSNVIAHQGVLDEGVSFIPKPFSITDLAAKVRQTLDRK